MKMTLILLIFRSYLIKAFINLFFLGTVYWTVFITSKIILKNEIQNFVRAVRPKTCVMSANWNNFRCLTIEREILSRFGAVNTPDLLPGSRDLQFNHHRSHVTPSSPADWTDRPFNFKHILYIKLRQVFRSKLCLLLIEDMSHVRLLVELIEVTSSSEGCLISLLQIR